MASDTLTEAFRVQSEMQLAVARRLSKPDVVASLRCCGLRCSPVATVF